MNQQEELEYQEEYETRMFYFRTVFHGLTTNWSIGKLTEYWYGTEKDHEEFLKDYTDRGLNVMRIVKTVEKPFCYDFVDIPKDNEKGYIDRYKENMRRQAEYAYLKSGY